MEISYAEAAPLQKEWTRRACKILKDAIDTHHHCFAQYFKTACCQLETAGYSAMFLSEEQGGTGENIITLSIMVEELSRIDSRFALKYLDTLQLESTRRIVLQCAVALGKSQSVIDEMGGDEKVAIFTENSEFIFDDFLRTKACRVLLYDALKLGKDKDYMLFSHIILPYVTQCTARTCLKGVGDKMVKKHFLFKE